MRISYDPAKRAKTLDERGLDFEDAPLIFADTVYEAPDDRFDYGELRVITVGYMRGRLAVMVWTPRGDARHIISMRKANDREKARYG